jgi:hypothetical protein
MTYTREKAIGIVRDFLTSKTRPDETTCEAVARLGIFCHGYDQWTLAQLRALYPWLAKRMPTDTPREQFLRLISAWDQGRTLVHRTSTTCGAKALDREGCLGFDRFSNEQFKQMFPQLFHNEDEISDG